MPAQKSRAVLKSENFGEAAGVQTVGMGHKDLGTAAPVCVCTGPRTCSPAAF